MSAALLRFFVPGHPRTKGSLSARARKCRCCEKCKGTLGATQLRDSELSSTWRKLVAYSARQTMSVVGSAWPLRGEVAVAATFILPASDIIAQSSGDLDKLVRNLLDAMQDAGVYANDSQVTVMTVAKQAVRPPIAGRGGLPEWGTQNGVRVTVTDLAAQPVPSED